MIKSGEFSIKELNEQEFQINYFPKTNGGNSDKPATPGKQLIVPYSSQHEKDATRFKLDCGAAAVEIVGEYYRGQLQGVGTDQIMQYMTNGVDRATGYQDLRNGLRHFYNVDLIYKRDVDMAYLRTHIDAETPLIALVRYGHINLRMDRRYVEGHWMVVVGYDSYNWAGDTVQRIIVHDPDWYDPDMAQGGYIPIVESMWARAWEYYRQITLVPKPL